MSSVESSGHSVDLNADMGESFGRYRLDDAALLESVTSASIACGFHAGDPVTMREAVTAARQHGVVIGAHPGYPDLAGFGRRDMALTPNEIEAIVVYQVGALQGVCASVGARLRYVKAHGALYNRAARDAAAANAIVRAVRSVDASLALLALAGSTMITTAEELGVRAVSEVFVDRAYRGDGSLVPRSEAGAVLADVDAVAERALRMVETGTVVAADGSVLHLRAESLCTHGDGERAAEMVRAVRRRLEERGIVVAPFMDG
ncbi:MAG TPA: 5-oxoprolinase subunit PxpA [Gemmatimonadaceae bacterium]|nr:5-oxoprolinase subunit PxpA [Gemmatimonadaceae bacterium]